MVYAPELVKSLAVGQVWRTRGGDAVRITCDRQTAAEAGNAAMVAGSERWRWATSTGRIVDAAGRYDFFNADSEHDLVELLKEAP